MILYKKDNYGIVTLTLDMSGQSVNVINSEIAKAFEPVLDYLEKDSELKGVIVSSAKTSFLAGGDLDFLHQAADESSVFDYTDRLRRIFRRFELLKVPVVAAINGAALGSGFEFTLACHHRIALDSPNTVLGLPEVSLGMIPGGGGIIRMIWMTGLKEAFNIVSNGRLLHVREALSKGLIDDIAEDREMLLTKARQWILSQPKISKVWDTEELIPNHSNPRHPKTAYMIADLTSTVIRKTLNNYPAVLALLNAMVEGAMVDFEAATRINVRYFTSIIFSKDCRNQTKAFWYDTNKIKHGLGRPKGYGRFKARKIGIIGAGLMGSGIAYTAAMQGIKVILKDVSKNLADQGRDYIWKMLDKLVQKQKMTELQAKEILERIEATEDIALFEDCDLVVEAVFENSELKKRIIKDTEKYIHHDTFFATNTASLPISNLAGASIRPENYVGMHFFSPVQTVPLVEIIKGKKTSAETIARAFDFVIQIGKIPIIANDSPAYFVTRVSSTYFVEGLLMLLEGECAVQIENAGLQAGMPLGPLAYADSLGFKYVLDAEKHFAGQMGENYTTSSAFSIIESMIQKFDRHGKVREAGFYEYTNCEKPYLWPELSKYFPKKESVSLPQQEIRQRLLFIQCLEAVKCLEEGVISNTNEANLGSIHGWGFAPFKGGVIQFINDFGVEEFVAKAKELEQKFGPRFKVPEMLEEMAKEKSNFL
jgi:3-hydroxyacyl-CoA dehydrogenase/enoyl-CoA hydratase/3-hydroxybutyryl-CoA epimerase